VSIEVQEEIKPPYVVRSSFVAGGLVLPQGYYKTGSGNLTYIVYEHFVQTLALEYGIPALLDGMEAERRVAELMDTPFGVIMSDIQGSGLHGFCPCFDWDAFMSGWGVDDEWRQRTYLIDAPDRLRALFKWFASAPMEQVAGMLALHVLVYASPYLRPVVKQASEDLFQRALRGIAKGPSEDIQFLDDMKTVLPDALCLVYSDTRHDNAVLKDTKALVEDIREAAVDIMRKTKIFSKHTISKVVEKLHRMYFEIGKGPGDALPTVEYHPESFLHTCMSIFEARSKQIQTYVGRPSFVDRKSSYPCYVTNASYYSESNHIVMPWGILQWPFYCREAPVGWNYGGIGATIAHEITHAFDMEGRLYNEHGVYKQWWTRRNRDRFIGRTRKVQKFFGKFKHYGMAVDGKRTLSENWADLGGMAIALNALKRHIMKEGPEKHREAYRNFFLSYAVSWRTLVRKEKMLFSLQTSVHAPSADRVDGIVPHFQEWVDAFDVKEGDALYVSPGERLKFF
jgi:putative endopeptidase